MVDNMVAIQSKVDFYAEWMDEVTGYISEELDHELPQDLNKVRQVLLKQSSALVLDIAAFITH